MAGRLGTAGGSHVLEVEEAATPSHIGDRIGDGQSGEGGGAGPAPASPEEAHQSLREHIFDMIRPHDWTAELPEPQGENNHILVSHFLELSTSVPFFPSFLFFAVVFFPLLFLFSCYFSCVFSSFLPFVHGKNFLLEGVSKWGGVGRGGRLRWPLGPACGRSTHLLSP